MRANLDNFVNTLKGVWYKSGSYAGGRDVFTGTTSYIPSLDDDIKALFTYMTEYGRGKGIRISCRVSKSIYPVFKSQVPEEQMIFWKEQDNDSALVVPIDGLYNHARVVFDVEGVLDG